MPSDARITAWTIAWDVAHKAAEFREEVRGFARKNNDPEPPLPDTYWALIAEANLMAQLASAELFVGSAAAEILSERDDQSDADLERVRQQMVDFTKKHGITIEDDFERTNGTLGPEWAQTYSGTGALGGMDAEAARWVDPGDDDNG